MKTKRILTKIVELTILFIVMILPWVATTPTLFYFAFNDNASNYTHTEIVEHHQYETNEVNTWEDIKGNNVYKINGEFDIEYMNWDMEVNLVLKIFPDPTINYNQPLVEFFELDQIYPDALQLYSNNIYIYLGQTQEMYIADVVGIVSNIIRINGALATIEEKYGNGPQDMQTLLDAIEPSPYLGNTTYELIQSEMNPSTAFSTAVEEVWKTPVFNWVENNILQNTIANFVNVFGIAKGTYFNNYIVYVISISIIYIVLDMVHIAYEYLTAFIRRKEEK